MRPDDIPQRVWDETRAFIYDIPARSQRQMDAARIVLARAILAAEQREREACAEVCDAEAHRRTNWMETRYANQPEMKERQRVGAQQSRLLATAIRNRTQEPS